METTRKNSPVRKVLRYTALAVVVIVIGFIVFMKVFVRDIDPIDDSAMKIKEKPAVPEMLNGYTVLIQAAGRILCESFAKSEIDLDRELRKSLRKNGKISPELKNRIMFHYKERFEMIERGAKLPYSQTDWVPKSPNDRIPYFILILNLAKFRLELARQDFDDGQCEKAFETVTTMFNAGGILELKDGGSEIITEMISIAIK